MDKRKPNNYWTKEKCHNEALKYDNNTDFQKKSSSAYTVALKNKWLNDIRTHMSNKFNKNGYWTKERLQNEALKYKYKKEFSKMSPSAYIIASRNGFINEICSHMELQGSIERRYIYKIMFPDDSIYIGLTCNFSNRINQHLNDEKGIVFKYIKETNFQPIFEILSDLLPKEDAAELEEFLIKEYQFSNYKILNKHKGGGLGGVKKFWTKEKCHFEALKYKTRIDFNNFSSKAYATANKNKWLAEICLHMNYINKQWNIESVFEESKKYKKRQEFKTNCVGAYTYCLRHNLLDELFPKQ